MAPLRKDIPGWPHYQADTDGSVWSRWSGKWKRLKPGRIGRYHGVSLREPDTLGGFYVHQLVLLTFVGPCPPGMESSHKNDVGTDNRLENLEWATHKQNCKRRRANGGDKLGESRRNTKLENIQAAWIKANIHSRTCPMVSTVARLFGVSLATVRDIVQGYTWTWLNPKDFALPSDAKALV